MPRLFASHRIRRYRARARMRRSLPCTLSAYVVFTTALASAENPEGGAERNPPEPTPKGRGREPPEGRSGGGNGAAGEPRRQRETERAQGCQRHRGAGVPLAPRRSDEPACGGARRSRRDGRRVASEARPQRNAGHRAGQAVAEAVRQRRIAKPRGGFARRERAAHTEEVSSVARRLFLLRSYRTAERRYKETARPFPLAAAVSLYYVAEKVSPLKRTLLFGGWLRRRRSRAEACAHRAWRRRRRSRPLFLRVSVTADRFFGSIYDGAMGGLKRRAIGAKRRSAPKNPTSDGGFFSTYRSIMWKKM